MKSILATLLCLLAFTSLSTAFQAPVPRSIVSTPSSTTALNVFGKKKSQAQKEKEEAEASKYWQGEWVCKDCGYIYNRVCTIKRLTRRRYLRRRFYMISRIVVSFSFISLSKRPNALACTLRNKDRVSVAHNARDLVVVTPKRWETASEQPLMEVMPPFSSLALEEWR